ncbi:two-component system, chemotaxis family, response regulator CheB [Desulfonauticus submarinus]|uniref:Protein-glutamate methylesterase/protein-glutamine glutaminase n=1 Tax=Desulfonauticus submarinus TaxID=206665 RepID=A0A1H0CS44_9BACT|nr:chemotaxis response regulator protein-glutamate methylesterase [Desulfonauticus submarinus]SDN60722.1 two-component system, chemotaxis family, response regulator CheB [Desulfonauticus submarinus]
MDKIKVLVVDDSAFMRRAISTMLKKDIDIDVVGTAKNGEECLELIKALDPDVVTLDIEMPVMDGLTALKEIMRNYPRPVIMVSSLTTEGAEATLKALDLGAADFIPKQLSKVSLEIVKIEQELIAKVKSLAKNKAIYIKKERQTPESVKKDIKLLAKTEQKVLSYKGQKQIRDIVAIGVSTGGPPVVQKILNLLPKDFPAAIVIGQHMPPAFTGPFAKRLNATSSLDVKEAEDGDTLKPGLALVAPGGRHLKIIQKITHIEVGISEFPRDALYKPSVDVLFSSVARAVGRRGIGIILTGMGSDGLRGAKELKRKDGRILAQSEESCVVYGMPRAVIEENIADNVCAPEDMPDLIYHYMFHNDNPK